MRIIYLPLEPYEERYTLQLQEWTIRRFIARQIPYLVVLGAQLIDEQHIETGVVLDAHARAFFALTQTAQLVAMMYRGEITADDVIYTQDMFHPGWSALPYILAQASPDQHPPRIYTHCLAQSVDPNDFTFPMRYWMRPYEHMVDRTVNGIFVASACQVEMLQAALFDTPIHQVGLYFDRDEVRERAPALMPWRSRSKRILFASRWDREKQPGFYMDLIQAVTEQGLLPDYEFAACTSAVQLRSNTPSHIIRARQMEATGQLTLYEGLTKGEYYRLLADSQLLFNCALQDFVSFTLLEASALGTPALLPAHLSFPETVRSDHRQLYAPWSVADAIMRLQQILANPPLDVVSYPADTHHQTLDRVLEVIANDR